MKPVFTESYFLSAGETNAEGELSLPLLVSRLIDIATAHANSLGIGNPDLQQFGGGWVLSRLTIDMLSYPLVNSTYHISTWIESTNRHFSTRVFRIHDAEGNVFGYSRSIWLVMGIADHTNLGLSQVNIPADMIEGTEVPIERQTRHVAIVAADGAAGAKGALVATAPPYDCAFQYCDLDFYRHVNTVKYVMLLLNRFPLEQHDKYAVSRLELSFLHEANYGMPMTLLRADLDTPLHSAFQLSRKSDSQPLLFARLMRRPRTIDHHN